MKLKTVQDIMHGDEIRVIVMGEGIVGGAALKNLLGDWGCSVPSSGLSIELCKMSLSYILTTCMLYLVYVTLNNKQTNKQKISDNLHSQIPKDSKHL